jgi:hypothetical protein
MLDSLCVDILDHYQGTISKKEVETYTGHPLLCFSLMFKFLFYPRMIFDLLYMFHG